MPDKTPDTVVPPARRRGRPRSDSTTNAVLESAYRLTATVGLRGATIDAIAADSGVSKMTIYKWWGGRLLLLIDAFLHRAIMLLPLSETNNAADAIYSHAVRYTDALGTDFGDVQRAVISECLAENGDATLFFERYLDSRRKLGIRIIKRGQRDGQIRSTESAEVLYDQIYGTVFYRSLFGIPGLNRSVVKKLVTSVLGTAPGIPL
jgi:AcrR family transcriptional regulator